MSDQGEKTCPLCAEEMDLTDQQLKPCKCGYQICVWCWHHIMEMAEKDETEGRCPACRSPYNKEKIVGTAANCEKMVSSDKKMTSRKGKSKTAESRKQLSSVRVVQRNLVYIVGLPLSLADEDLLQRKEYFAQYGKVLKVSMSRTSAGAIQQFANSTCSVYITYSKEEEAVRCIQSVHGFLLDGQPLRACFGTTKYCHAWLRSVPCTNPDCLYLHEIGSQEDSFTKDEVISAYTRSRVQQITGAVNSMQRRSGSALPPPADDYCNNSSASAGKPSSKTAANNSPTNARGSPPNSSSGRSASLPAGALWGTRALNNQLPPVSAPSSNGLLPASAPSSNGLPPASAPSSSGPLKQKAETCALTCSTAVANNSQVLSLAAEAGKKVIHSKESGTSQEKAIHSKESGTSQEKGKINMLEPVKQPVGADDATYSTEKPAITVHPASSFMNSQLHITPSLKDKDIHRITPSSATNTFDLPLMSNGPTLPKDPYGGRDIEEDASSVFSLASIDRQQKSHASYEKAREPSPSQTNGKSVIVDDVCISRQTSDLRLERQTQGIQDTTPEMEDDLLSFNAQRHRDPEVILEKSYSSSPSISLHSSGQLKGYTPQFANGVEPIRANMQTFDHRADSVLLPSSIGELPNGYPENVFSSAGNLGSTVDTYYSSNESRRMHMDRFEGGTATADHSTTADRGENNIISNILSMDFDPWNESVASQNLVKLLGETDNQQGSLRVSNSRKLQSNNQSRFSFAREGEPMNPPADSRPSLSYIERSYSHRPLDQDFPNSRSYQLDGFGSHNGFSLFNNQESNGFAHNYSQLSSNKLSGSRSQMAAPPGFSAPNRAPPPGFTYEKMEQNFGPLSGTHMLETSLLRNEYQAPSIGNVNNGDIEFMDPAILAVGKGRVQNGFNVSCLDMSPSFPPQPSAFENEARLQLLMQRSLSLHQNQRFPDNGDNFSPFNDAYGVSSRVVEQTLANNLSPFSQLNLPQNRNSVMSNGQWDGWNGVVPSGNDLGMAELLRNERLGYNKFYNGYEESKFRMPNSGELYNRTFGI
ncbi:uncharacterized protein LOC132065668 isoform X1 [Lycium ferocissimum]|uniref:uncharacterized protein LOC132065668 isoform X1 n=1 Tax=Lycium ferocissimum TaxID=112874 RepID=UPI002815C685|nr:uncharacterized protein LOC132065668 isoform X1 [Lycium ferocissimum]